ncbi:acetoacetate decarboxylase family protein [Janthinobacterium lividum]|uniref:acetoacetate decarboxylase family protein n=1 Tax=Janthinobacterium lividum TaxID=29581 RepID=UPI002093FD3D|nr:acetoacetate decarboxylase family protein [Janthinobacterium lividum]
MARPSYIYQGGSVMMHSPLQLKQSEMYGYFVKGDLAKLQATVNTTLNQVAGSKMTLKALSPYVMLTFTRVNHADSANPVDQAKGWITEVDIVTWIMVGQMDEQGKLAHIYWYPCHIFVDDAMALINGRELFGYPKYLCEYEIPAAGSEPLRCSVAAKGFQHFRQKQNWRCTRCWKSTPPCRRGRTSPSTVSWNSSSRRSRFSFPFPISSTWTRPAGPIFCPCCAIRASTRFSSSNSPTARA